MQNTVSIQLKKEEVLRVKDILKKNNWGEEIIRNEYVVLRMKNPADSVSTLYSSGKIVFQGNEDFTTLINDICINSLSNADFVPHIGVDEVGKGDYFGPLVVVACFVNEEFASEISTMGITDSKKLSDSKILKIYEKLRNYDYYYPSIVSPVEYNKLINETGNVAILLAKQHSKVIEKGLEDLQSKDIVCNQVVIDQFSKSKSRVVNELGKLGRSVEFKQFHKGESDIAVACASIFARGIFLEEMDRMGEEYYFSFPKGASNVIDSAKRFVELHGKEELGKVAKISFKTTQKVSSLF